MKRTRKCYNEEEFELDNVYNEDNDRMMPGNSATGAAYFF